MKLITMSRVGYNHPSQANWNYGVWKVDFIDTEQPYCLGRTVKETFGGEARFLSAVLEKTGHRVIETSQLFTKTGTQKITGVQTLTDIECDEFISEAVNFLTK